MRPIIRKRLGQALATLAVLGGVWAFTQPLPYVIVGPGPAFNVLGEVDGKSVITIDGVAEDSTIGSLDLLTISAYGHPGATPPLNELISALFSSDKIVLPIDSIYPEGKSTAETEAEQSKYFESSKSNAITAALAALDWTGLRPEVTIKLDEVGGPSGGLIFALGVVDKLSPGALTGGKAIAGTGTISAGGEVGAIGGIRQKLLSAQLAGDRFFLAPKGNCKEINFGIPEGLRVVPVATLDEALAALKVIASDGDLNSLGVCGLK